MYKHRVSFLYLVERQVVDTAQQVPTQVVHSKPNLGTKLGWGTNQSWHTEIKRLTVSARDVAPRWSENHLAERNFPTRIGILSILVKTCGKGL